MTLRAPLDVLHDGVDILGDVLRPAGFWFELGSVDRGSCGAFAQGSFERDGRVLSFSVREKLGLVQYAYLGRRVSHEAFMRVVALAGAVRYPGYTDDPLQAFRDVSADMQAYGARFVTGSDAACLAALDAAIAGQPPNGFAALEFARKPRAV